MNAALFLQVTIKNAGISLLFYFLNCTKTLSTNFQYIKRQYYEFIIQWPENQLSKQLVKSVHGYVIVQGIFRSMGFYLKIGGKN